MARTSAPHSATAQFFINAADNEFLNFKSESPQGWGYAVFGKVVVGQRRRRRDRAACSTGSSGGHDDVPLDDVTITARPSSPDASAASRDAACRAALAERRRRFVAPAHWRAIDFISDLHLQPSDAAHLRRVGRAPARTPTPTRVFILGDLFEAWVGDDCARARLRGALRRGAARGRARSAPSASWPATATSWSATRCSTPAACTRLPDPTVLRRLRPARRAVTHGDALCLDDTDYQRFRAMVRRPGVAARASGACRSPSGARSARAMRAAQQRRREPRAGSGFADVDPAAALALAATPPARRRWSTATPTARRAMRSRRASCATC